MAKPTILDLFSGIGGFSLSGRWSGYETIQFVEIDPFCKKILAKNFPGVPIHDDIKTFDATQFRGRVDLLTAGVPCQPASIAGQRKGTGDDRWLWQEAFRVIRDCEPEWIILENVLGLLSLEQGMVFENLLLEVESLGYETQTLIIPACGVNAPHRRNRVWIIANAKSSGHGRRGSRSEERRTGVLPNERCGSEVGSETEGRDCVASDAKSREPRQSTEQERREDTRGNRYFDATDTTSEYGERDQPERTRSGEPQEETRNYHCANTNADRQGLQGRGEHGECAEQRVARQDYWQRNWVEVASEFCGVDARLPGEVDRLKSLGNSIVPQVAFQLMKAILEYEINQGA